MDYLTSPILRTLFLNCEHCNEIQTVKIEGYDDNILDDISSIAQKIKLCCSRCQHPTPAAKQNYPVTEKQLDSFRVLIAEAVDRRMDVQLEYNHAENIGALLNQFDLHCADLSNQLKNPQNLINKKNILWVVLPYSVCKTIIETLSRKLNIPQNWK